MKGLFACLFYFRAVGAFTGCQFDIFVFLGIILLAWGWVSTGGQTRGDGGASPKACGLKIIDSPSKRERC